jgi:hypothetical protein
MAGKNSKKAPADGDLLQDRSLTGSLAEIDKALTEAFPELWEAMKQALAAHEPGTGKRAKKFKYAVSIGLSLSPHRGNMEIEADVSYGVRKHHKSPGQTVTAEPELPLEK